MSSYRPQSFKRPLRPRRKKWRGKVIAVLVILVVGWFGIPAVWQFFQKKMEPRLVVEKSQDEAMDKLMGIVRSWSMDDEDLKAYAEQAEQHFAWIEDERAKDAARHLLAIELEGRGLWKEAHPLVKRLLLKRLSSLDQLSAEEKNNLLFYTSSWGDKFVARGYGEDADVLYEAVLKTSPDSPAYLGILGRAIDFKNKSGDMDGALALIAMFKERKIQNVLKEPVDIRQAARYLLLEDELKTKKTNEISRDGEDAALELLERTSLSSVPEMGRILLSRNKPGISNLQGLSLDKQKELLLKLDRMLGCFRASGEEMVYAPEIMLTIAKVYALQGDIPHSLLWLNRTEGTAMTLGVDQPRVLDGKSFKEEISELRNYCREKLQTNERLTGLKGDMDHIARLLQEKQWQEAQKMAASRREQAKATLFDDGYIPVLTCMEAQAEAGLEQWSKASSLYQGILAQWNSLSEDSRVKLAERVKAMGYDDLYQKAHRDLAAAYLKQDMMTKAGEVLKAIGEELPKKPAQRTTSRRRR